MHTDKNAGVTDLLSFRNLELIDLHVQEVFLGSFLQHTFPLSTHIIFILSAMADPILNKLILLIDLKKNILDSKWDLYLDQCQPPPYLVPKTVKEWSYFHELWWCVYWLITKFTLRETFWINRFVKITSSMGLHRYKGNELTYFGHFWCSKLIILLYSPSETE